MGIYHCPRDVCYTIAVRILSAIVKGRLLRNSPFKDSTTFDDSGQNRAYIIRSKCRNTYAGSLIEDCCRDEAASATDEAASLGVDGVVGETSCGWVMPAIILSFKRYQAQLENKSTAC